jgi:hypothetical protein
MKLIPSLACLLVALSPFAYAASQTQTFPTSSGPVQITSLNHASTLIEAGGRVICPDFLQKIKRLAGAGGGDFASQLAQHVSFPSATSRQICRILG